MLKRIYHRRKKYICLWECQNSRSNSIKIYSLEILMS